MANTKASTVYGVNEKGEVVATSGTGSTNVTAFLPHHEIPVDDNGRLLIVGLSSKPTVGTALQRIGGGDIAVGGATTFTGATSTGAGYAVDIQRTAPFAFRGVRLIFKNYDVTSPMTINKCGVAVTPNVSVAANRYTSGPDGQTLTWTPATVSGQSSFTVPQAVADAGGAANSIRPGNVISDFIQIQSVDRADGSPLPFLRTRVHMPDTSIPLAINGTGVTEMSKQSNAAVTGGHFVLAYRSVSISVANLFTASLTPQYYAFPGEPVGVIYYTDQSLRTLMAFGDSRTEGAASTTGYSGWPNRFDSKYGIALNSSGVMYAAMNEGVSGQRLEASLENCRNVCSLYKPQYASIFGLSVNSMNGKLVGNVGQAAAQANMDMQWALVKYTIDYLQQLGITPVVFTSPVDDSFAAADCALIKTQNARVMALPASVIKIDAFTLLTDPATINSSTPRFLPIYRAASWPTDRTHWNDAANAVLADAVYAAIA